MSFHFKLFVYLVLGKSDFFVGIMEFNFIIELQNKERAPKRALLPPRYKLIKRKKEEQIFWKRGHFLTTKKE